MSFQNRLLAGQGEDILSFTAYRLSFLLPGRYPRDNSPEDFENAPSHDRYYSFACGTTLGAIRVINVVEPASKHFQPRTHTDYTLCIGKVRACVQISRFGSPDIPKREVHFTHHAPEFCPNFESMVLGRYCVPGPDFELNA